MRTWSKGKGYLEPRWKWLHTAPWWRCWRLFNHGCSRGPRVRQGSGDIQRVRKVGSVCRFAYGTWHKLLMWLWSFPQFFRTSLSESLRRHLQRNRTHSAYYPRGFCGRLCSGFVHFRLRWFQMMLGNSFGFWSIKRHSLLKTIFNLNLTFDTKNRLRLTASVISQRP